MAINVEGKHILDATCGSRMMWFDKRNDSTVYMDWRRVEGERIWQSKDGTQERLLFVDPDVIGDFKNMEFPDDSFEMVVFDPPHMLNIGYGSWTAKKYGKLDENWFRMLHDGFAECMRVLKPYGTLIFKWSEYDIKAADVWNAFGEKPLFGHRSGKQSRTLWGVFMKGVKSSNGNE